MKYFQCIFILLLLHSICLPSKASELVYLNKETNDFILTNSFYDFFEDPTAALTIAEITKPQYHYKFSNNQTAYNYNKNTKAAYWLRFTIIDTSLNSNKWILELLSLHTQQIKFYEPISDSSYKEIIGGQLYPFHQRPYEVTNFTFDLHAIKNKPKTFYIRIQSEHSVGFEFKIRSQHFFTKYTVNEYFFLGCYYGILLIMAVYNIFLFITAKEKIYLFYVFYVLSCMLNSFAEDGFGFQFIWPTHPEWNWPINNYIWSFLFLISFVAYVNEFLELKLRHPKLQRILFFATFLYFLQYVFTQTFLPFDLYLLPFICAYILGIYSYLKGYKPARFFILGFSFVFLSIIIYQLRIENVIPHNLFTVYSFNYGIILEVVVLSIALADRFKIMKIEKEHSQKLFIEKLEENQYLQKKVNLELETKVNQRTQELRIKSEELQEANQKLEVLTKELNAFASKLDLDNWTLNKKVIEEKKARLLAKELSFEEFNNIFPNEQNCLLYLENLKWKDGFVCKKCKNEKYAFKQKLLSRKCSKCNYIESVLTGTLFQGIKFDLAKAFYITYITVNKTEEISIDDLSDRLTLNRITCWKFRKKVLDHEQKLLKDLHLPRISNWELLLIN